MTFIAMLVYKQCATPMRVRVLALMHLSFSDLPLSTVFPPHSWGLNLRLAPGNYMLPPALHLLLRRSLLKIPLLIETLSMHLRPHRWEVDLEQIDLLDLFPRRLTPPASGLTLRRFVSGFVATWHRF